MNELQRMYDSFAVFEEPIVFGDEPEDVVYGVLYNHLLFPRPKSTAKRYLEYLVGAIKWQKVGNEIRDKRIWIENEGGCAYSPKDRFVEKFCKQAYKEHPVGFHCQTGIPVSYKEDDLDGSFIVSKRLWKDLWEHIYNEKKTR